MHSRSALFLLAALTLLSACDSLSLPEGDTKNFPKTEEDRRKERIGKLTGDEGITLAGPASEKGGEENNPLGVNSFLWRATLDTLSFMPFAQVDPFGGVIITDWYEDPNARGERFKLNVLILDRELRADSVKVSTFKQRQEGAIWQDVTTDPKLNRQLEDAILTRARELRVKQLGR